MQEVGDHEEARGPRGQALARVRVELEHGVEGQELDARARVERLFGHDPQHLFHGARAGGVAVAHGLLQQPPGRVEEGVVDGPAVDAHALHLVSELAGGGGRGAKAQLHALAEPGPVPPEVAPALPRRVPEAVHLAAEEPSGGEAAEDRAAASRPEVDGDVHGRF